LGTIIHHFFSSSMRKYWVFASIKVGMLFALIINVNIFRRF